MRYLVDAVRETYKEDADSHTVFSWTVERKAGGMNGLIYRLQSDNPEQKPLAVKISQCDARQRTLREFGSMTALIAMGLPHIVPQPIVYHDQPEGLPGDVLVMEWLAGESLQTAPAADNKKLWLNILQNFVDIHSVFPIPELKLKPAVMSIIHPQDLLKHLRERRARLPEHGSSGCVAMADLDDLLHRIEKQIPMIWDTEPQQCIILCDANPRNIIVHGNDVRFVDWANSGWGTGVFDIADMLAQPDYIHLSPEHRAWIRACYAEMIEDPSAIERILIYERMMYFFWICGMTQPLFNISQHRLKGTLTYDLDHYRKFQKIYWELAQSAFA